MASVFLEIVMQNGPMNVDRWVELFRVIGLQDDDMHKWHVEFEQRYPDSQLAGRFGLSRSTLLYYDSIGLLSPSERTASNYRLY